MEKKQKPYVRARTEEHLFEAFRRKIYLDKTSASQAITSIFSNYFIYHQKYLTPVERELIQEQFQDEKEITYEIVGEEEEEEETGYELPRTNEEGFLY